MPWWRVISTSFSGVDARKLGSNHQVIAPAEHVDRRDPGSALGQTGEHRPIVDQAPGQKVQVPLGLLLRNLIV
jgi:hypothetical protein